MLCEKNAVLLMFSRCHVYLTRALMGYITESWVLNVMH